VADREHTKARSRTPYIAHCVTSSRTATKWGKPFRTLENDLYWVVTLGETQRTCGYVDFKDFIPPENYGGVESPLGALGPAARTAVMGFV
jgi:hypothetical protein